MKKPLKRLKTVAAVILWVLLASCSSLPVHPESNLLAYTVQNDNSLIKRYMPIFVVENKTESYNLIGTASAKITSDNHEVIYIDPKIATIYTEKRLFKTLNNAYTNLVYRIHFAKIPDGFFPFYIGAGNNTGLIVIVTLNHLNQAILYTTVHSCGCYLAFVPTSYMPESNYPQDWSMGRQVAYSENLPRFLEYKKSSPVQEQVGILIRDGTHRVKDIWLLKPDALAKYNTVRADVKYLDALKHLPLAYNQTTSFFENAGSRDGYVKGSYKFREWLLMSWWAFDSRIGEDKVFGTDKNDGIPFYTSIKAWARDSSDMRDFNGFLTYWGWKL